MAKLYPPQIAGTLPAFYGTTLVVPFSMSLAVGPSEVKTIVLKIKKSNSNEILFSKNANRVDMETYSAIFYLTQTEVNKLLIGQFYRAQIAYLDNNDVIGYYSSVGVIKYTTEPEIEILGLSRDSTNLHNYEYICVYSQESGDTTEKLYSTNLKLYDKDNNLIEDLGTRIHSVLNDVIPSQASEIFNLDRDLEINQIYKLYITATTVNGIVKTVGPYKLIQRENTDILFDETRNISLKVIANFEEGSALIQLKNINPEKEVMTGSFLLSRTEAIKPYRWEKIKKFTVKSQKIADMRFNDYTVEQGKNYIYAIQQYNNYGVYSNRILSEPTYMDFEDLFLLDGERQLKIRFNPKVSSMKDSVLETKTNTIGSKYPFITRNGRVNYKEFNISGLISYKMDNNYNFITEEELHLNLAALDPGSNLTSDNIYAERIFKLKVLEWLNNGKVKILKSPVEGNYVVRLMNVNMTPIDTVGRMLHNFSCAATEIADFNYNILSTSDFYDLKEPDKTVTYWKTIPFSNKYVNENGENETFYRTGELLDFPVYSISIVDATPGSVFEINGDRIYIGVTGAYAVKVDEPIYSVKIPEGEKYSGSMTIEYRDILKTSFDDVRQLSIKELPVYQIVGNKCWGNLIANPTFNIIENMNNVKNEIVNIPRAKFIKRNSHKIYVDYNNGEYSTESTFYLTADSKISTITLSNLEPLSIYEIYYSPVGCDIYYLEDGTIEYEKNGDRFKPYTNSYYDPYYKVIIEDSYDAYDIIVNGETINLAETEELEIKDIDYQHLQIGDGVIAELMLFIQTTEYAYETEDETVAIVRREYDKAFEDYKNYLFENSEYTKEGDVEKRTTLINTYNNLISILEAVIKEKYEQKE